MEGRGQTTGAHATHTLMCAHICPVAKLPSEVDGSKYVCCVLCVRHKSSSSSISTRTFPPFCCCVCFYIYIYIYIYRRTRLRNAHFVRCPPRVRCSSLPAHQPIPPPPPPPNHHPPHTQTLSMYNIAPIGGGLYYTHVGCAQGRGIDRGGGGGDWCTGVHDCMLTTL
jgi:hypothetical protein